MNVRIEVRFRESWDQPGIVVHPDDELARQLSIFVVDAWYEKIRRPVRATIGDNPDGSGKWAEGEVVYSRGA